MSQRQKQELIRAMRKSQIYFCDFGCEKLGDGFEATKFLTPLP